MKGSQKARKNNSKEDRQNGSQKELKTKKSGKETTQGRNEMNKEEKRRKEKRKS